jgi:hypothetical protein
MNMNVPAMVTWHQPGRIRHGPENGGLKKPFFRAIASQAFASG